MARDSSPSSVLRFGAFDLDREKAELRRNGTLLHLQDQTFRVLLKLVEHPGALVRRDELRAALWPAGTYVDFDHGLGSAIGRLREVLGDSAANPRFIETVVRHGYRFIAPVQTAEPQRRSFRRGGIAALLGAGLFLSTAVVLLWRRSSQSAGADAGLQP